MAPKSAQEIPVRDRRKGVRLNVLDWGGTGRPLVLLAGLGNSAHIFSKLAPKLAARYHVYSISRRGFGDSTKPEAIDANYTADRLGDDVVAVIDALKLDKPVLAGHSIAGEELSSVGTRYPNKVAGLIYLDAGFPYAYYDSTRGDLEVDLEDVRAKLERLEFADKTEEQKLLADLLDTSLPALQRDLKDQQRKQEAGPGAAPDPTPPRPPVEQAVLDGMQKYGSVHGPVLAIFAVPHEMGMEYPDPVARATAETKDLAEMTELADAFQRGNPSARVVRLAHANHYVFLSNESDVLREMNAFIASLP